MNKDTNLRGFDGHYPALGNRVYIDPAAVVIGDVVLGDDASLWPYAVVRGDVNTIRVGMRTNIQDGAVLHVTHASVFNPPGFPLTLGDDVTVGHSARLHGATVGNRVLIGIGATVLDGAVVSDNVVVGAASLVAPGKHLESGYLYLGIPARRARPLTDRELEYFVYSAENYVKLKDTYRAERRGESIAINEWCDCKR